MGDLIPKNVQVEVRAKAEAAIASKMNSNLQPKFQLDPIWYKDDLSINLPAYVKAKSTTMGFPETVSQSG